MAKLNKANREAVMASLINEYPDAKCALDYDSAFHLLVAVMLSAQTTDVGVNKITPALFKATPDSFALARLSQEELEGFIRTIGLYRNKAKNLLAMAAIVSEKYNGQIPGSYEELIELPGVGRKTANVVLAEYFKVPRIAVDTHVFRLANRIGITSEKDVLKTEEALMKALPKEHWIEMHHALIFHGRRVCKAQNPACEKCCIDGICKQNGL